MTWTATSPSRARLAGIVGRAAFHTTRDRALVRHVEALADIPPRIAAISPAWLSAALRTPVRNFTVERRTSATSVRATLAIDYVTPGAGPNTVFAKSTPSLVTRLANGASATSLAEARFMMELRPSLADVEIPGAYHCAADARTFRSIQLVEDLVATKGAAFADVDFRADRHRAESAIDLLADVHRTFSGRTPAAWLRTQPEWWTMACRLANLRASNDRFLAGPLAPPELRDADRVWRAIERSIAAHADLPATVIHADPHLANWYVTANDDMGLCDWQCVCSGHWSLDVAYALVTLLRVEDRRAWERDLLARYLDRSGAPESFDEAWLRYRQQMLGALLKWSPTLHRPPGFPEMQPAVLAEELLRRITAAIIDLEVLHAV
jgi:hypothetical protein